MESSWFRYWSLYLQKSVRGDFETEVSFIWKSLFASGRWSKSLWGVVMGMPFNAIGASILGSYGFKDRAKGFREIRNNYSISEYFRITRWLN